ncbi:membrane fusion protein, multidrug efflux system [Rhizobiales bacterium GAS191]|nr:membrane fusion protein, multidrug efflux system [Rhizobiales bacterium GAS191]
MHKWLAIPVLSLVAAGVAWGWLEHGASPNASQTAAAQGSVAAVPVVAAEVRRADVPIFLTGLGTVRAFNSVVLTSRVDGEIVKINFQEGEDVRAGDVLVEIDSQPLAAALAQAQAAKLKDQAQLANARLDLDRAQKLVGTGAGTTQQLDTARAQVAQLEASTTADQATIEAAQVQLNYCKIRSPITGRTGTRLIDIGNIVRAGSSSGIVMINQMHPISVAFDLPADSLPQIRDRMRAGAVSVVAQDHADRELAAGKLAVIDNQVNVATGTIRYKATFDNTSENLWPGQFVTIRLQLEVRRDAVTIPAAAVQRGAEGTYAFVIDNSNIVRKRPIKIGFANRDVAVIDSGVQQGELVATDGQYRIEAGTRVEIVPQAAQTVN